MKKINNTYITRNGFNILVLIMLAIVPIVSNVFKYNFLPEKYFYDYQKVLTLSTGGIIASDSSFDYAATFFKNINIFNFDSLIQWSIWLGLFGNIALIILFLKHSRIKLISAIFWLLSSFIMSIYVFIIGKEFIQFLYFLAILVLASIPFKSSVINVIFILLICVLEGVFFRSYYLIVAAGFFAINVFTNINMKFYKKIILVLVLVFVGLVLAKKVVNLQYLNLVNLRNNLNISGESSDRRTMINNILNNPNNLVSIFLMNYFINLFRIVLPIELLLHLNPLYYGFFLYQLLFVLIIGKALFFLKKLPVKKQKLILFVFSYFLTLGLFEPDFGSLIRHECVISPLLFVVLSSLDRFELKYMLGMRTKNWTIKKGNYGRRKVKETRIEVLPQVPQHGEDS